MSIYDHLEFKHFKYIVAIAEAVLSLEMQEDKFSLKY
jgi:hypothetical protein